MKRLALLVLSVAACGSPLETAMSNAEGCGVIGRALLEVCGGELAAESTLLFEYLNCNILPGCPGGQVEQADVEACAATIRAQVGAEGSQKPRLLECRDALAVECEIARADCGDAEKAPAGRLIGFHSACAAVCAGVGASCMANDSTVTDCAAIEADTLYASCETVLGCGRAGAFSASALEVALGALQETTCDGRIAELKAAQVGRAFCAPKTTTATTSSTR